MIITGSLLLSQVFIIITAMMLQLCLICRWFIGMLADLCLGVLFMQGDIEKLTGSLDLKQVFVNSNVFYFMFYCATVDLD